MPELNVEMWKCERCGDEFDAQSELHNLWIAQVQVKNPQSSLSSSIDSEKLCKKCTVSFQDWWKKP